MQFMNYISDQPIPMNEIIERIQSAHMKSPDEITAFFCIMISESASLTKMRSIPALSDLMIEEALPNHCIINQGPKLNILKEIGDFYYKVIEQIVLSGFKSQKVHIYELTVTVLNEINVETEIYQKISHFIENGLKGIQPNDDNRAFLTYVTSYIFKNPQFTCCFESYCEAISKIQKHSFAILKANAHLNSDSPYLVSFKKLQDSYLTIINTIEKPFIAHNFVEN